MVGSLTSQTSRTLTDLFADRASHDTQTLTVSLSFESFIIIETAVLHWNLFEA